MCTQLVNLNFKANIDVSLQNLLQCVERNMLLYLLYFTQNIRMDVDYNKLVVATEFLSPPPHFLYIQLNVCTQQYNHTQIFTYLEDKISPLVTLLTNL